MTVPVAASSELGGLMRRIRSTIASHQQPLKPSSTLSTSTTSPTL